MARRRLLALLATTASALQRPAPKRATRIKRQAHEPKQYQIIAGPACEAMAQRIQAAEPARFTYHETSWDKFPDGTDRIVVGGFQPRNEIAGEHVLMLASFHDNDVTLSQFQVMVMLLMSFVESLTIVLPFYPTGTMERVVTEVYDLHTLQNRFYLHGNTVASLHTTVPCLIPRLEAAGIDAVAFPDDGAAKRFKHMFDSDVYEIIVCGKVRDGDNRVVTVQDGDVNDKKVVIVDDLVQTGGTLYECGAKLLDLGAASVSAFVAHGVFPREAWKRFARGGDRDVFDTFYVTNSIPTTTDKLPSDDVFEVIDLTERVIDDLDNY